MQCIIAENNIAKGGDDPWQKKGKGPKKQIRINHALVLHSCWRIGTEAHRILEIFPIEMMRVCLETKDVARITARESSTIRHARINGRLKGILVGEQYLYSLWDVIHGFRPKKNIRRKWSVGEKFELKRTGACRTRSRNACKIMRCKMRRTGEN